MYFSAKLFALQDDEVAHLDGKLYDDEGEVLWDEIEEYENQLKEHLKGFKYTKKKVNKDENRYITHS